MSVGADRTWVQVVVQMEVEAKNLVDMMDLLGPCDTRRQIRCAQRSHFIDRAHAPDWQ